MQRGDYFAIAKDDWARYQSWSNRAKKKAVGKKIVIDAEDLLSIARELESSSNIVHINGKEYTGKKSWIANRLREIVASAPINR